MDVKIQQNGLDKGDRKIHKYTNILRNTDTQKKIQYTHKMDSSKYENITDPLNH